MDEIYHKELVFNNIPNKSNNTPYLIIIMIALLNYINPFAFLVDR